MKKITWISVITAAVVVGVLLLVVIFGIDLSPGREPPQILPWVLVQEINQGKYSGVHVGEIMGERKVGQSFVSHHNNLARIDVFMATFGRRNARDVIFHLRNTPNATEDLAKVIVNASEIQDNRFHRFGFPALPDSKDKSYYFYIESPESVPEDAITIWFERNSGAYPEGSRFEDNLPQPGDFTFRTYYRQRTLFILKEFIPRFLKDRPFAIFFISLCALLIVLLVRVRSRIRAKHAS